MIKYKNKTISGIIILVISIITVLCSCSENTIPEKATSYNAPKETEVQIKEEKTPEVDSSEINQDVKPTTVKKESTEKIETPTVDNSEATVKSNGEYTCILSVRCDTILNNMSHFDSAKVDIVPGDGVIFAPESVVFYEGESVFNVLVREMKRNKIHLEFEMTPLYETAYIKGIANIYEFDCGELSGWLYKVNNESPGVGCSIYKLKDGDVVEWIYTCG